MPNRPVRYELGPSQPPMPSEGPLVCMTACVLHERYMHFVPNRKRSSTDRKTHTNVQTRDFRPALIAFMGDQVMRFEGLLHGR
jgi:hypothetical protein